jgi:hypothetical protein
LGEGAPASISINTIIIYAPSIDFPFNFVIISTLCGLQLYTFHIIAMIRPCIPL